MNAIDYAVDRYFAVWNETDPDTRGKLIERTWSQDAEYVDPLLEASGRDGIHGMVTALHTQYPGHMFRQVGPIDVHHDRLRFNWEMVETESGTVVIEGIDVGVINEDGLLASITGFFDRTPGLESLS